MILPVVRVENLDEIKPLLEEFIQELGLSSRTDADHIIQGMTQTTTTHHGSVFHQDGTLVWVLYNDSIILKQRIALVAIAYTKKELRGSVQKNLNIIETVEAAAKLNGCHATYGADWKALGDESAGKLWTKAGFVEQESFYVKQL